MSSIVGIGWIRSTIKIIKHTKKIAIANKESIICVEFNSKELLKLKQNLYQ